MNNNIEKRRSHSENDSSAVMQQQKIFAQQFRKSKGENSNLPYISNDDFQNLEPEHELVEYM